MIRLLLTAIAAGIALERYRWRRRVTRNADACLDRMRANADADLATRAPRRECDRDTLVMSGSESCGPCDLQFAGRDAPVTVFKDAEALERLKAFYLSQGGEA